MDDFGTKADPRFPCSCECHAKYKGCYKCYPLHGVTLRDWKNIYEVSSLAGTSILTQPQNPS